MEDLGTPTLALTMPVSVWGWKDHFLLVTVRTQEVKHMFLYLGPPVGVSWLDYPTLPA